MKYPARIVAVITFITASISIALWASGYAPLSEHTVGWKVSAFTVMTSPLFFALAGLVFAVPCLYLKRNQPGFWETKQGRIAAIGIIANPLIMLLFQILFPLEKMDLISDQTGDLAFLVVHTVLLILLGNYAAVLQPGSLQGLRNRWTLASDAIWTKTHRFFGKALILALLVVSPLAAFIDLENAILALMVTLVLIFMLAIFYSWRLSSRADARNLAQ